MATERLESGAAWWQTAAGAALLLLLHVLPATLQRAGATLGDDHLRTTFPTQVHLPQLIGHAAKSFPSLRFRLRYSP